MEVAVFVMVALAVIVGMILGVVVAILMIKRLAEKYYFEDDREEEIDEAAQLAGRIQQAMTEPIEQGDYHQAVEAVLEILQEGPD